MVLSRYAELVEPGKLVVKEEQLQPNDDQLLVRITHCGICQYDGVYYKGIIGQTPMSLGPARLCHLRPGRTAPTAQGA